MRHDRVEWSIELTETPIDTEVLRQHNDILVLENILLHSTIERLTNQIKSYQTQQES